MKLKKLILRELHEARQGRDDPRLLKQFRRQVDTLQKAANSLPLAPVKVYKLEGLDDEARRVGEAVYELRDAINDLDIALTNKEKDLS